jgi:hypothetical protein
MSNDSSTAAYKAIMQLVYEQEAQSNAFKADVQNRSSGMMQRQAQEAATPKTKQSDQMDAAQSGKSYIANYVKLVRDSWAGEA